MKNTFKYLEDTYLFEDESVILSQGADDRGSFITLEHTIFHPQGGGQPSDVGIILRDGSVTSVEFVAFTSGEIRHYVKAGGALLNSGDKVTLKIDRAVRLQNSKCHTAGHLVQAAVENLPYDLQAVKGYHFSDGPYVEFNGTMPANIDTFISEVNAALAAMIKQGHGITTKMVNFDELQAISKNIPNGLPREKPLRVVTIDGFNNAVPCGGTHLRNTNEMERLEINKVKSKKGNIKISYTFG